MQHIRTGKGAVPSFHVEAHSGGCEYDLAIVGQQTAMREYAMGQREVPCPVRPEVTWYTERR